MMDKEALQNELDAAYKRLGTADKQIKILSIKHKQNQMIFELLETAGFITEGKLQEARYFVQTFISISRLNSATSAATTKGQYERQEYK